MSKILMPWMLIASLGALLCHAAEPEPPSKDQLRFAFITTCAEQDFFIPVKKGMEDAAKAMGVNCTFTGTEGVDIDAQAEMVRQAVADGFDGIALNIIDPEKFDAVIKEATEKGVPVVGFNVDDHATPNARLSAVNQRLYDAGRTLGKQASDFIPKGSHILMTLHDEGVSALDDRLRGEQDALKGSGITWTVVVTGNDPVQGKQVVIDALRKDPRITTVLCTGQADTEASGLAIEELAAEGTGKDYTAAGFDLSPNILRLIKAGHIRFTTDQQPYMQGFFPVVQLTLYKRYGLKPSSMDAGAGIIDRSNVDQVIKLNKQHYR